MESGDGDYYTWEQQLVLKSGGDQTTYETRKTKITDHIESYDKYDSHMSDDLQEIAKKLHSKVKTATESANEEANTLRKKLANDPCDCSLISTEYA